MKKHFLRTLLLAVTISLIGCGGGEDGSSGNLNSGNVSGGAVNSGTNSGAGSLDSGSGNIARSNTAPTITGSPSLTVKESEAYVFIPVSEDADNDDLTFSIQNLPEWMNFDSESGELSGTPSKDDVGSYASIEISVTDGDLTTSLGSFEITVKATSAVLSWIVPTSRADDSPLPLSEIAGYKVYIGSSESGLTLVADITDPNTTEYEFSNLADGTHYFAVSTYNTAYIESDISVVVEKTI